MKKGNPTNMIFGLRPVIEALNAGQELEKIFVQKNLKGDTFRELFQLVGKTTAPMSKVPIEKLNRFTRKNHQGVVAFVSPVPYHILENLVASVFEKGEDPFFIALDRVTDVRNFGAIARSAEGMGVHGIIIPGKNSAQINADAIKTSAGALSRIPVSRVHDLQESLHYLRESGCQLVACTEKGNKPIYSIDMKAPLTLIFGSEEDGVSDEILKLSDHLANIPMQGSIASLNVSSATSICAYEVVRQRNH